MKTYFNNSADFDYNVRFHSIFLNLVVISSFHSLFSDRDMKCQKKFCILTPNVHLWWRPTIIHFAETWNVKKILSFDIKSQSYYKKKVFWHLIPMNTLTQKHFSSNNPIDYLFILLFILTHHKVKNNKHIVMVHDCLKILSRELDIPALSKKTIHGHRAELVGLI